MSTPPSSSAREARQKVIFDAGKRFTVVLEEQALRTWFGTAEVQAGVELGRLLEMMSVPTISLGIIPLMTERTAVASAGLWIFDDSLVALETPTASIEVARPQEIELYAGMFEHLRGAAVFGRAIRHAVSDGGIRQVLDIRSGLPCRQAATRIRSWDTLTRAGAAGRPRRLTRGSCT